MLNFPFKKSWETEGCKSEVIEGKQVSDMLNFLFNRAWESVEGV